MVASVDGAKRNLIVGKYQNIAVRVETKALIGGGGVYIHIFTFCPTNFF